MTIRVLYINDRGFQYGAGIATLRQIQSLVLVGHKVSMLCWHQGAKEANIPFVPPEARGKWLGLKAMPYLTTERGFSQSQIIDTLVLEAKLQSPDVIIVGNIHGARWPLELLPALRTVCPVVAFMHDCYYATGRCAYTGSCTLYRQGCNYTCPTWQSYPSLEPQFIFDQWLLRRDIFCGADGIPIAANSRWTQGKAQEALVGLTDSTCIYYGLDAELFQPIDRAFARNLLNIPQEAFVVLGGAVNVNDYRKGGHIFSKAVDRLKDDIYFLAFGANSTQQGIYGTGLLRDYRKMPLVYSAADVFVGTSLEEAFGQTFCEAAACGIPVIAFEVDGIPEVARHGINARLASDTTADALVKAIQQLYTDSAMRQAYGQAGRAMVESEFTLQCQGDRWTRYFEQLKQRSSRLPGYTLNRHEVLKRSRSEAVAVEVAKSK
ncbi:MAG: glycosyltransferase [Elainellaceae cyanobacterium]